MVIRIAALTISLLAVALAGCDTGDGEGTTGAGGADGACDEEEGCVAGTGGAGPLTGEEANGDDEDDGTGPGATGSTSSVGSAGGSDCTTCCQGDPIIGQDQVAVRVQDSNSFASPSLVRALLPTWDGSDPLPVRPQEFLNTFVPSPSSDGDGGIVVDAGAGPHEGAPGAVFDLQITVHHPAAAPAPRSLAVLIDTSPSARPSVDRVLGAIDAVLDQVRADDSVAVYTWTVEPAGRVLRPFATLLEAPLDRDELLGSVQREIEETGERVTMGPAVLAAMEDARIEAQRVGAPQASVVLVSDGTAGIDGDSLAAVTAAASDPELPVRVLGIGVGPALTYGDRALDRLTDAGGGGHVYFDGGADTDAFLASRFEALLSVALPEVRLVLQLPEGLEVIPLREEPRGDHDPSVTDAGAVRGQPLAAGGSMTFHEVLRWTGEQVPDACAGLGWMVLSRSPGTEQDVMIDGGAMALGDVAAGLHESRSLDEGRAVLSAAAALQGPTPERLAAGVDSLRAIGAQVVEGGGSWQDHDLHQLCTSIVEACGRRGVECGGCEVEGGR